MLQLAIKLARFTGAEAEELRRAMGFMKDPTRLPRSMEKLHAALRREGYNDAVIQKVVTATTTFSAYGFPESHAIGFAQLAYASTWLKVHRTAEFYTCLLNNQPMGFYSPATLLQDAKREGRNVTANPVCVQHSDWACTVEDAKTIRLGLRYVRSVREAAAQHLLATRREKPFASLDDFLRRTDFTATERRALAAVGALDVFSHHRRTALWQVEAAWSDDEALFKQFADAYREDSPLAAMSRVEEVQADFSGLGLTVGEHPMALVREQLPDVCRAKDLRHVADGQRVTIAGSVVVPQLFERLRLVITQEPSLRISGRLQNVSNVTHVKAEQIEPLRAAALPAQASHDFH
jgi:error-prone DNA polymerase